MPTTPTARQGWLGLAVALTFAAIAFVALSSPAEAATNRYVGTTGSDTAAGGGPNDCTVEASPCLTIQHAIDVSGAGDTIEVEAGVYTEVLEIEDLPGLTIRGAGDDLAGTVIQAHADRGAGFSSVIAIYGRGQYSMESLLIRHGHGGDAGGIFVAGDPTLPRDDLWLALDDVTISQNDADFGGGGIGMAYALLTVNDTVISDNTAAHAGGGINVFNGGVFLSESAVTGNAATGPDADGGGIYGDTSWVSVRYTTVSANTAGNHGGGVWWNEHAEVALSTLSGNQAGVGGACTQPRRAPLVLRA